MTTRNNNRFGIRIATTLALALLFGFATVASAAQSKPRSPEVQDNHADLRDDTRDYNTIVNLIDDWHDAYARNNYRAMSRADAAIASWLNTELRESRRDVSEATRETSKSRRDARGEVRDVYRAASNGRFGAAYVQAVQATAASRELRDDRGDLKTARIDVARTQSIANELSKMESKFDRGVATRADFERKSALLKELQSMARAEVKSDNREIREDRR